MLRLGAEVGADPLGLGGAVRDDHDLARAGQQVDADAAEELALGLGDVAVAGTEDLVDRGDARGADREGGDRLDAADRVDLAHAAEVQGGEQLGVDLALGVGRRAGDELGHARDLRGDGGHEHGGDQRDLPAGDVEAAAADGKVALADLGPVRVAREPGLGQGAAVEVAHAARRLVDRLAPRGGEGLGRALQLLRGDAELAHVHLRVVEARGVVEHRDVAAGAHVGDDLGHGLPDGSLGLAGADEGVEAGVEVAVRAAQDGHRLSGPGRRRRSRRSPR